MRKRNTCLPLATVSHPTVWRTTGRQPRGRSGDAKRRPNKVAVQLRAAQRGVRCKRLLGGARDRVSSQRPPFATAPIESCLRVNRRYVRCGDSHLEPNDLCGGILMLQVREQGSVIPTVDWAFDN